MQVALGKGLRPDPFCSVDATVAMPAWLRSPYLRDTRILVCVTARFASRPAVTLMTAVAEFMKQWTAASFVELDVRVLVLGCIGSRLYWIEVA